MKNLVLVISSRAQIFLTPHLSNNNLICSKKSLRKAEDFAKGLFPNFRDIFESTWGPSQKAPKLLINAPPALGKISTFLKMWYEGKVEESKKLPVYFKIFCDEFDIPFIDSNEFVKTGDVDGEH